jgi:hypothetical protein
MFSEGNAAPPVGCDSLLKIVMAVCHIFFYLNCLGWVWAWQTAADNNGCLARFKFKKMCAKWPLLYAAQAVTPEQITQQNSLQRAGATKRQ